MKSKILISIVAILSLSININAQRIRSHIQYLASDSLYGRDPGTIYEKKASTYIGNYLKSKCRASVEYKGFSYFLDSVQKKATNVIGYINNHKEKMVIICAHYDGLGMNSRKSKEFNKKNIIHNGADDNASGVSLIMELAHWLSKKKKLPFNVLLLFTSGHEDGLFGAEYFVQNSKIQQKEIVAVIDFDMVGHLNKENKMLRVGLSNCDSLFLPFFNKNQGNPIQFRFDDSNIDFSDLKFFKKYAVPLLFFTTGLTEDYHKSTDDSDKINYQGMKSIIIIAKELILELEKSK